MISLQMPPSSESSSGAVALSPRGSKRSNTLLFALLAGLLAVASNADTNGDLLDLQPTNSVSATDKLEFGNNETVYFIWHPMKTAGTSLCALLTKQLPLMEAQWAEAWGSMDVLDNCRLSKREAQFLHQQLGVTYHHSHQMPTDGHVHVMRKLLHRRFFFYEPAIEPGWLEDMYLLPPFLAAESTWRSYLHVFMMREPTERVWSAVNFFELHTKCGLPHATDFLSAYFDGNLPTHEPECNRAASIARGQVGNFYVRHLTGHWDAVGDAWARLRGMHLIDMNYEDIACRNSVISRVFGVPIDEVEQHMPKERTQQYAEKQDSSASEALKAKLQQRISLDLELYDLFLARQAGLCTTLYHEGTL